MREKDAAPEVASVTRLIDQSRVDRYGVGGRDHNPIHFDTPEAAKSQFGRPVAHGMLVLALVSEAMTKAFGDRWSEGGHLKVRWRAPVLTPARVTAIANLRHVEDGVATYDVSCEDENGEVLLAGMARGPIDS
tara:strand:- start:3016 stop:3414 length:399 start_codon:yes stop_codon:yes gene_type:complete